jgi:hypothetical protein
MRVEILWYDADVFPWCFLGIGGCVLGLLGMLTGMGARGPWARAWWALAALLAVGAGVAVALGLPAGLWWPALALAALCVACRAARTAPVRNLVAGGRLVLGTRSVPWVALLLISPLAWAGGKALLGPKEARRPPVQLQLTPQLTLARQHFADTDRGRPVQLYHGLSHVPHLDALTEHEATVMEKCRLLGQVIRVPANWQDSNCHGWVFAGGHYWVVDADVELILQDNGYVRVAEPRPGDLAIFRDAGGGLTHSGVVRFAGPDNLILIESKWGCLSRFLHPPERHLYPDTVCTYYRSPRAGHLLRGLSAEEAVAAP